MSEQDAIRRHRRQTRLQIYLPFLLGIGSLLGLLVTLFSLTTLGRLSAQQVAVSATCLMIPAIFLPIIILFLVLDYGFLLGAMGMGKLTRLLLMPFGKLHELSAKLNERSQKLSAQITDPIIELRAGAARWRYVLGAIVKEKPHEEP